MCLGTVILPSSAMALFAPYPSSEDSAQCSCFSLHFSGASSIRATVLMSCHILHCELKTAYSRFPALVARLDGRHVLITCHNEPIHTSLSLFAPRLSTLCQLHYPGISNKRIKSWQDHEETCKYTNGC